MLSGPRMTSSSFLSRVRLVALVFPLYGVCSSFVQGCAGMVHPTSDSAAINGGKDGGCTDDDTPRAYGYGYGDGDACDGDNPYGYGYGSSCEQACP